MALRLQQARHRAGHRPLPRQRVVVAVRVRWAVARYASHFHPAPRRVSMCVLRRRGRLSLTYCSLSLSLSCLSRTGQVFVFGSAVSGELGLGKSSHERRKPGNVKWLNEKEVVSVECGRSQCSRRCRALSDARNVRAVAVFLCRMQFLAIARNEHTFPLLIRRPAYACARPSWPCLVLGRQRSGRARSHDRRGFGRCTDGRVVRRRF